MKNSRSKEKSKSSHLSATARKLRKQFIDTWELADPAGLALLDELCCCYDRLQAAKDGLREHGAVIADRFGQMKMSPWFLAVRDETSTLIRLQKTLGLEVEGQDNRPGRPDGWVPNL